MLSRQKLISDLLKLKEAQDKRSDAFEDDNSYEMAYLARWYILEKAVRKITLKKRQDNKIKLMKAWVDYAEDGTSKRPENYRIGVIPLQVSKYLPHYEQVIVKFFGNCPALLEVMKANGRYRNKRNRIAHSADKLSEKNYYKYYKPVINQAISELYREIEEGDCLNN